MTLKPYNLILLDLDDTLFDFRAAQRVAFRATLSACGLDFSDARLAEFNALQGELWQKFEKKEMSKEEVFTTRFGRFFEKCHHDGDGVAANRIFLANLAAAPKLLPGALELCTHLYGRYRMGVVTNGDAVTQRDRVARSALSPYLRNIVVSDDIGVGKPHPEIFWRALDVCGVSRGAKVLMVGDNLNADIRGAAACGFDTCWLSPLSRRPALAPVTPTYTVGCLDELRQLI